ncbi:transcription factor E2F7 isoform X2 [Scophthalmus maximus]|uniref:transcription factor E2F7 isoform X2 n=1 Tax=Scophthalmus maximus TaxID=52904 RepID=UPI0015E08BE4|nr:transcription factor E2F7 isoform X2 [Scophthalmus maximus]
MFFNQPQIFLREKRETLLLPAFGCRETLFGTDGVQSILHLLSCRLRTAAGTMRGVLDGARRLPRQHNWGGVAFAHDHWWKPRRVDEHTNANWLELRDEADLLRADWLCFSLMEVECVALKDLTSPRKSSTAGSEEDGGETEQKENICAERRRSTPLKSAESAAHPLLMNRKGATAAGDLAHVTPIKRTALAEPWTPTANLKMLISAASPDIRDREMRKVLFRPIENEKDRPASPDTAAEVEDSCQFEAVDEEDEVEKKPSRKQKSLGLLCQKFLALYPDYPPPHSPIWISLDEVAANLGVERRRIYDIVNVLESLTIVGRIAKNSYTWYGRQQLEATLEELQRRGRQQGYHLQMELAAEARAAGPGREDDGGEGDAGSAGGNRKDKSLRIMSQKFVMLFLVSKTQTVTLDAAAKILIEESQDSSSHSKYKTKVRRLYDIANVLTSLGLIKKVHVREERGRKPAFKWLGPVEFNNQGNAGNASNVAAVAPDAKQPMAAQDPRRARMARHASFNITPTSVAVQRQVNSAPCSPRPELTGVPNQPVDYSRKTAGNSAVCRLQFGNGSDIRPGAALQTHSSSISSSQLPPSSTPMKPPLHPEYLFTSSSSPHCLAYLPSLSQPSVVMLYRPLDTPDPMPEGQRSPRLESGEGRKRRREGGEDEDSAVEVKKKGMSALEECEKVRAEPHREAGECSQMGTTRTSTNPPPGLPRAFDESQGGSNSSEAAQPSHYLYVPNNAGLNSLNFFLSAGQPPASLALPPSGAPALALPYVLLPSSALSHYSLVANGVQQQGSDPRGQLSFSLPAMMSPAHFTVRPAPHSLTAAAAASDISWSPVLSPCTPEQSRLCGSAAGAPHSPPGPRQTVNICTPEPLTPHTPKDTTASASKAFFQTPCTLGGVVSAVPAARKRGSAQRRLDVGHPPTS